MNQMKNRTGKLPPEVNRCEWFYVDMLAVKTFSLVECQFILHANEITL